jgi:hypothetical protein
LKAGSKEGTGQKSDRPPKKSEPELEDKELLMMNLEELDNVCLTCGKRCQSRYARDIHMAVHTKEKKHVCEVCE